MRYAIQHKSSGQLIDYCDTKEQVQKWLNSYQMIEAIDTDHASKLVVTYTELSGPWGYGHQEESFSTYGGLVRCIISLHKWIQSEFSVWGPDVRDIRDYFRHCRLYVNGNDRTAWLLRQIDKLNVKELYV
jgi:hypothetical protein